MRETVTVARALSDTSPASLSPVVGAFIPVRSSAACSQPSPWGDGSGRCEHLTPFHFATDL